jgi:hypothetical protein
LQKLQTQLAQNDSIKSPMDLITEQIKVAIASCECHDANRNSDAVIEVEELQDPVCLEQVASDEQSPERPNKQQNVLTGSLNNRLLYFQVPISRVPAEETDDDIQLEEFTEKDDATKEPTI